MALPVSDWKNAPSSGVTTPPRRARVLRARGRSRPLRRPLAAASSRWQRGNGAPAQGQEIMGSTVGKCTFRRRASWGVHAPFRSLARCARLTRSGAAIARRPMCLRMGGVSSRSLCLSAPSSSSRRSGKGECLPVLLLALARTRRIFRPSIEWSKTTR